SQRCAPGEGSTIQRSGRNPTVAASPAVPAVGGGSAQARRGASRRNVIPGLPGRGVSTGDSYQRGSRTDADRGAATRGPGPALGGIKSNAKRRRGLDPDALGKLESPEDALRISARLTVAAAAGELAAPQVNAALSALKQWLAAFEADVLDKRLAAWEAAQGG